MKLKLISLIMTVCLVLSMVCVGVAPASADTYETYAQSGIQGSAVLHCFNWSYNNIKAKLPEIAAAGYTAVQTSPVQRPRDYSASYTDTDNQWWKLYQPLGFSVADGTTWLGTKAQLTSLCTEADKYGIKVIVDIVANHLANNGTDGGTFSYLNTNVETDMKNALYYHTSNKKTNDNNRYNITQYHLGQPDLNTANTHVQQRVTELLEECIDCGVDGFRFDAAKHIELPNDPSNCKSDFWKNVLGDADTYAEDNNKPEPFFYGEILGSPGPNCDISSYTTYMAVTDNYTGDRALDKAYWNAASELADDTYYKGADADQSVLWVESHDTYMGDSGSAWTENTKEVTSDVINKAWAIVGARADSTSLFFARPNATMGAASTDTNWKSTAVAEVNKFKNHFAGTTEYISYSGNSAYIERGQKGVVISKLDGGGSVNLTAHQMQGGTYKDQVTGNTFTVSGGKIKGTVGSTGVAVVYNVGDEVFSTITASKLYLKPNSNWTEANARFAMYVYNAKSGADAWTDMTSLNNGYYSAAVPSGTWTNVIFCRMNPSISTNNTDEGTRWDYTKKLFPNDNNNCYTIASGAWTEGDGTWSVYDNGTHATHTYGQPTWTWAYDYSSATVAFNCSCGDTPTVTDSSPTPDNNDNPTSYTATVTFNGQSYTNTKEVSSSGENADKRTVYAINNAGWSNVSVYWWGGNTACDYPGKAMTPTSVNNVYSFEIPNDVNGLLFTNGTTSKQSVDIISGISDGAIWTINSTTSNGEYTVDLAAYYLVGSMNGWSNNSSYAFTFNPDSLVSGNLEFKLSNVELPENAKIKVHSESGQWYPDGTDNDYTVTDAGTYNVYFRPNHDGGSGWYEGYFLLENVTPYTITWEDGDGNTLKTDTVTYGNTPEYSGETPTKTATNQYSYTFNNTWSPDVTAATADATYTAQFDSTVNKYTVRFVDYDGTELQSSQVDYGSKPQYTGVNPTRESDGATTYTFSGWAPQITDETIITGDTTYRALYSTNVHTYTITWLDGDGNTIRTEACTEGVTPQYLGETPTKEADGQFTYTFKGWTPDVAEVTGDATYTAEFTRVCNYVTSNNTSIDLEGTFTRDQDDKAPFDIGDTFKNFEILGVQLKKGNSEKSVRFVAVLNNEVLKDAEDYGFIAMADNDLASARTLVESCALETAPDKNKFSCKNTDNNVSGDYGKRSTDTGYKYVTMSVNNIGAYGVAVMFYLKDNNNNVYYATYNNGANEYKSCSVDWDTISNMLNNGN